MFLDTQKHYKLGKNKPKRYWTDFDSTLARFWLKKGQILDRFFDSTTCIYTYIYMYIYVYICIYMYIYIYMLERHWVVHILASRELMGWPPWKLIGCPPFGGPFSHYKNRGFWGFLGSFLVPNSVFWVSRFCLISHLFFYFLDFLTSQNPSF